MAKASSLVRSIGMPTTAAATSMSRTAMNARPVSLRIRFFAASAIDRDHAERQQVLRRRRDELVAEDHHALRGDHARGAVIGEPADAVDQPEHEELAGERRTARYSP
jgi:hypothetical protein